MHRYGQGFTGSLLLGSGSLSLTSRVIDLILVFALSLM